MSRLNGKIIGSYRPQFLKKFFSTEKGIPTQTSQCFSSTKISNIVHHVFGQEQPNFEATESSKQSYLAFTRRTALLVKSLFLLIILNNIFNFRCCNMNASIWERLYKENF